MKISQTSSILKNKLFFPLLVLLLLISVILGLSLGAVNISLSEIAEMVCGGDVKESHINIMVYTRIPRVLACAFSGAGLAVSGVLIQNVLANPLASPNIIGVNAGAGFAVLLANILFPSAVLLVPVISFAGSFLAACIILAVGLRSSASRITLILVGAAVSAIFNAGSDALINFFPDSVSAYSSFRSGGFSGVTLERIFPSILIISAAVCLSLFFTKDLDLMLLGSEQARALGLNVRAKSLFFLMIASFLSAASVSICGMIGFVGLIVPHIMRRFVGEDSLKLIAASSLGGAVLVTAADLVSRLAFAPYELPAGILIAFIGGPFFIFLLVGKRRKNNHA